MNISIVAGIACAFVLSCAPVLGQGIAARFDVTCSLPVLDQNGGVLPGNDSSARRHRLPSASGVLVQVIDAGANGKIDLPNADGSPGGDDSVFGTTMIGEGIAPNVQNSGRFSTSFHPPPPRGCRVYVRVFNAPAVKTATHWGQSGTFTVDGCRVFDAAVRGLWATTQPLGSNPLVTDTDGDGYTDYEELVANTHADNEGDYLRAYSFTGQGAVEIEGRAGRMYELLRTTDDLNKNPVTWTVVAASGVLTVPQTILLADPDPQDGDQAFYRVDVIEP